MDKKRKTMYDILLKEKERIRKRRDMWKQMAIVVMFGFIFTIVILAFAESPNDLRDELEECQAQFSSWTIKFKCDYGSLVEDGLELNAISTIHFSNYTLYKTALERLDELDDECEVIE